MPRLDPFFADPFFAFARRGHEPRADRHSGEMLTEFSSGSFGLPSEYLLENGQITPQLVRTDTGAHYLLRSAVSAMLNATPSKNASCPPFIWLWNTTTRTVRSALNASTTSGCPSP